MPVVRVPVKKCRAPHLPAVCVLTGKTDRIVWKSVRVSVTRPPRPRGILEPRRPRPGPDDREVELPFHEDAYAAWHGAFFHRLLVKLALVAVAIAAATTGLLAGLGHAAGGFDPGALRWLGYGFVASIALAIALALVRSRMTHVHGWIRGDAVTLALPSHDAARAIAERFAQE